MAMYDEQSKKMLILYILEILMKETDENNPLSQKEIEEKLYREYHLKADRKSVKRNLISLADHGYEVRWNKEEMRKVKNEQTGIVEDVPVRSNFYYQHNFTEGELRLLIDLLLYSTRVNDEQCRKLAKKLAELGGKHFQDKVHHIAVAKSDATDNKDIFLNVETIEEAIREHKKIAFRYFDYGTDKKMHPKKRSDGSERYVVSPYQMAVKNGNYYLICNFDKYDDISNYRIDRIKDVQILKNEPAKPFESLQGSGKEPLNLSDYMKNHVYMYSSEVCRATLRIVKPMIGDVIDLFGKDVVFFRETDDSVCVSVRANERSILQFAQNFAPDVVITEPKALAEKVKNRLQQAVERYKNEEGTE